MPEENTRSENDKVAGELRGALRSIVKNGAWDFEQIDDVLGVQYWMIWFNLRLKNKDPFFEYDRDEREYGQADLFRNLFRKLHRDPDVMEETRRSVRSDAAEGLCLLASKINRQLSEGETVGANVLHNIFELVGRIRVHKTDQREPIGEIIRTWIDREYLLEQRPGSYSTVRLHQSALLTLTELQVQENENLELWQTWFDEDPYKLAAFSGMARSRTPYPPEDWVLELLRYTDEKQKLGETVLVEFALQALYMGDLDPEDVMEYLWHEVHRTDNEKTTWERLQNLLADSSANLLDYDKMQNFIAQRSLRRDQDSDASDSDNGSTTANSGWSSLLAA
jgi:hypothetical protein